MLSQQYLLQILFIFVNCLPDETMTLENRWLSKEPSQMLSLIVTMTLERETDWLIELEYETANTRCWAWLWLLTETEALTDVEADSDADADWLTDVADQMLIILLTLMSMQMQMLK